MSRVGDTLPGALRRLGLFWKLLLPGIVVVLLVGVLTTFVTARLLAIQERDDLDGELLRASVAAELQIQDRALYLSEAARTAANTQGVAESIEAGDAETAAPLIAGLLAVRDAVDHVAILAPDGTVVLAVRRGGEALAAIEGDEWTSIASVADIVQSVNAAPTEAVGVGTLDGSATLAAAASVRSGGEVRGVAVVGMRASALFTERADLVDTPVGLFDPAGHLLVGSDSRLDDVVAPSEAGDDHVREFRDLDGDPYGLAFAPLRVGGERLGVLAVGLPVAGGFELLGGRIVPIVAVALAAFGAIVGLSALVARRVLVQVRELVGAHEAIAAGDLDTRSEVVSDDELGELAVGFNDMADQLAASYRELEARVESRTFELQRLYESRAATAEAQAEFLSSVSHEFRSPLFAIAGYAELMADPDLTPTERGWAQQYGKTILESARALQARVDELLDMARSERANVPLNLDRLRVEDAVESLRGTVDALARRGGLETEWEVDADLSAIVADPVRLREVLLNLASNAVKYTPPGGRVSVRISGHRRRVTLSVSDTGPGIPADAAGRVFDPFYTVEGIEPQGGQSSSGLGLALTKRIVEAHGGTVELDSEVGVGSTFTVTLPVSGPDPARPRTRTRIRATTSSR